MPDAAQTQRLDTLREWLAARHPVADAHLRLELVAGDASFRRYYRVWLGDGQTRILMDAPPDKENSQTFVSIADAWRRSDLPVPALYGVDLEAGFIELKDLGDTPLQCHLGDSESRASVAWHEQALALAARLQNQASCDSLPRYDAQLLGRELDLFPHWCLKQLLGLEPPACWQAVCQRLIDVALSQPTTVVHRDYDAMNLMVHEQRLWLIDFQDAVCGPLSYDLVSLLRGRYCRFPRTRFTSWVDAFRRRAIDDRRLPASVDSATFLYMADCMAAQRSLKVLGIFCRLALRDGKPGYLARLPHFLDHLRDSLTPWPEFGDLLEWLDKEFAPRLERELSQRRIVGTNTGTSA